MEFHLRKLLCADLPCSLPPAPPAPPLPSLPASPPDQDWNFSKVDGSKHSHDISPFLIPMFCALGAAFIVVAYFTFFKKYYLNSNNQTRRRNPRNLEENQQDFVDENHGPVLDHPIWYINTIGLQQSVIDSIAVFRYKKDEGLFEGTDCSVCLNEFEEDEALRLLPKCSHAFHIPCIDTWLRSHKNCPSCRAPIVCEGSDTQTGETGETNLGLTPVENLDSRNEVRSHQEDSAMGGARTEFLGGLPSEEGRPHPRSDSKNCDIRVFSDLGGFRAKVKEELEPVRRSISMDASSASMIYRAMANIHEAPQVEGCSSTRLVQSNTGNSEKVEKSRLMKTSSLRYFLDKGPVSMKRSFSSSGKLLLPRRYSRSQDSNVPL